jgi:hypothetical protein
MKWLKERLRELGMRVLMAMVMPKAMAMVVWMWMWMGGEESWELVNN